MFIAIVGILLPASSERVRAQIQDITVNNGIGSVPLGYAGNGVGAAYEPISTNDQYADQGSDFNTNPDPRVVNGTPVDAIGYVNAGDVPDKEWDLEAFGYNATQKTLTYVGGFNPTAPIVDGGTAYTLGDIFLSPASLSIPMTAGGATNGSNTNYSVGTYQNPGYTYAIHFTGLPSTPSTLTYTIYQLSSSATLLDTVAFNGFENNGLSDPSELDISADLANGSITAVTGAISLQANVTALDNASINTLMGETLFNPSGVGAASNTQADNYVASFSLASLDLSNFNVSLTESCGNDLLKGSYDAELSSTPEPRSMFMGGIAMVLFGLALTTFRRHCQI